MIKSSTQSNSHTPSYLPSRPEDRVDRSATLPGNRFFPLNNLEPAQLPLAAPEDSDLDTASSIVSNRDNVFASTLSTTHTVLRVTPPPPPSSTNTKGRSNGSSLTPRTGQTPRTSFTGSSSLYTGARGGATRRSTFPRHSGVSNSVNLGSLGGVRVHRVTLLDGENLEVVLMKSATGSDLYHEVCQYLGLRERDFFGLFYFKQPPLPEPVTTVDRLRLSWKPDTTELCAIHHRGVPFWLKPNRRVVDQCKKNSRLWFGVRIFPPRPHEDAIDEMTRYLLCLQLRRDLVTGKLACSFFTHTLLSAYWVQSELGDWDLRFRSAAPSTSTPSASLSHSLSSTSASAIDYLAPLCLAAPLRTAPTPLVAPTVGGNSAGVWLGTEEEQEEERRWCTSRTGPPEPPPRVRLTGVFLQRVAMLHRSLRGLIPSRADILFLQTARKLATYGIDFHRVQNACSSTMHISLARRLSKDLGLQRSQSLRPRCSSSRPASRFSLSPSHKTSTSSAFSSFRGGTKTEALALPHDYPSFLGVFHGGIYVYRGRIRLEFHPWSAIVKMAYRKASFRLCLRLADSEKTGLIRVVKYDCGTTALAKRIYRSCVDHHCLFRLRRLETDTDWTAPDMSSAQGGFPFATGTRLRRLQPSRINTSVSPGTTLSPLSSIAVCTVNTSARDLVSANGRNGDTRMRPLSEPDIREVPATTTNATVMTSTAPMGSSTGGFHSSGRFVRSAHKFFLRLFRKPTSRDGLHPAVSHRLHASQSDQRLQQTLESEEPTSSDMAGVDVFESASLSTATSVSSTAAAMGMIAGSISPSEWNRPPLPGPIWRLNPADCDPGVLMDPSPGLTISRDWRLVYEGTEGKTRGPIEWRGCRATWGVTENPKSLVGNTASSFGPRRLFFEVRINGNEPIRVGWATDKACLSLGDDNQGFAYQSSAIQPEDNDETLIEDWFHLCSPSGDENSAQVPTGAIVINGASTSVAGSTQGDVIGCYLDLDARLAHWTKNGVTDENMTLSISNFPQRTVFYPACAVRNSSLTFNFGDTPFAYGPMLINGEKSNANWLPLASANLISEIAGSSYATPAGANQMPVRLLSNPRTGWHLKASNSPAAILSPDRLCVRALMHSGWQTLYASESILAHSEKETTTTDANSVVAPELKKETTAFTGELPSVYFEVRLLESLIATPGAGVFVGFSTGQQSTANGLSSGSTFGIVFEQGSQSSQTFLVHAGVRRPYGKALHCGDVIGCTLNAHSGLVFWSLNGEYLGHIVQICVSPVSTNGGTGNASAEADDVIYISRQRNLAFTPLFCLSNTSIEVNFGDGAMPLRHLNKHTNCIPMCHYQRVLDEDPYYSNLFQQLSPPPPLAVQANQIPQPPQRSESSTNGVVPRHYHSFAQYRLPIEGLNGNSDCIVGVHKSASCVSAPAVSAAHMNIVVSPDILDALTILRSRIPVVPVKTGLWGASNGEESGTTHRPITSPTFAAPCSQSNQVLPIVRTHRVALSAVFQQQQQHLMPVNEAALSTEGVLVDLDGSLRRSASDGMQRTLIRHLCGQSQQSSASAANQSSSSSLIERRMAQIPLVPTRIVNSRGNCVNKNEIPRHTEVPEAKSNGTETKETITTRFEYGEETIARRRHVTDLTLPPSTVERDCSIASPSLSEAF